MGVTTYFLLVLVTAVAVSGRKVSMKSISLTTDDGVDVFNHRGRELSAGRRLSLKLELHSDDDEETPKVDCPELEPFEDSDCPFDKNVKFRVHTKTGVETSHGYSCHTFANKDHTCIVTMNGHGGVQGVWLDHKTAVGFNIKSHCKGKNDECADIDLNPTIGGCGADELEVVQQGRRLGAKKDNKERKLSWQEAYWLTKWNNCYSGDDTMTNVFMGLAVGSELTSTLGGVSNVQAWLEAIVSEANAIYRAQLNVKLHVTEVEILTSPGSQSFDNAGCTKDINTAFSDFRYWNRPAGSSVAIWHYFDDCHQSGASAIGLGYIGALCNTQTNVGMTHYNAGGRTWLTFAHEVGHNFGAPHTFEEGQGTTGGIMDYGDKLLNNEYQFNTKYRKNDICGHLSSRFSGSSCAGKFDMNPQGQCGNGKLESNEECECPSGTNCACCQNCQLKAGAQCSPHFGNDCCTSTCQYADTWTECTHSDGGANGLGYCRNGICGSADCGLYGLGPFCGIHSDNPCKKKCEYAGSCQTMNGWTSGGEPINYIRDGAICTTSSVSYGECRSGVCTKIPNPSPTSGPNPTPPPTNPPTPPPTNPPTNPPTPPPTNPPTPPPTNPPTPPPTNPPTPPPVSSPTPPPTSGGNCLGEGVKCLNSPDGCCAGLRCPVDEFYAGLISSWRKVKCVVDNTSPNPSSPTPPPPTNPPTPPPTNPPTDPPVSSPTPPPTNGGNCLAAGVKCLDNPNGCCSGLRCPVDEYYAGKISSWRKVKCQVA